MSIKINNVFYTYLRKTPNYVDALNGVNLTIEKNEFICIVGETGSGKSTLIQHLNGLLIPTLGSLDIDEYHVSNNKRKNKKLHDLRHKVGVIFQFPEYQLFEETVLKDVLFGARNFGDNIEEATKKAKHALSLVGINESYYERSPFELSGGERRRVAIAGILAVDPEILVLDEPTAGLDYQASEELLNLIVKLHKEGKTIIIVTHDMDLVYSYSKRVIFMEKGSIKFDGDPKELFKLDIPSLEKPHLFEFVNELNARGFAIPLEKINSLEDIDQYI